MREAIKRYMDAAQSLTEVPRERAERIARRLAGNGMIDPGQIRSVASDFVERSRENRKRVTDMVASEIRRQVSRIGLATQDDIERLGRRVQALESGFTVGRRRTGPKPIPTAVTGAKPKRRAATTATRVPVRGKRPARKPASKR
jgi:polyhydroxyalkanoate synthesis regulator phasin